MPVGAQTVPSHETASGNVSPRQWLLKRCLYLLEVCVTDGAVLVVLVQCLLCLVDLCQHLDKRILAMQVQDGGRGSDNA